MNSKVDDEMLDAWKKAHRFRQKSKWREAGDQQKYCAKLLKNYLKKAIFAATCYTEAGFDYLKVDKNEALNNFNEAISLYCDNGRFDVAARLERIIAEEHFRNKHWEEAALHYRKAANFLSGEQMFDQCDSNLEHAAYCFIEMAEYQKAANTYVIIADGCLQSNLRQFNSRDFLLRAIMCLIAIPIVIDKLPRQTTAEQMQLMRGKGGAQARHEERLRQEKEAHEQMEKASLVKYEGILQKVWDFQSKDSLWRCSKEALFVINIINYRLVWDRTGFANHIYYWNNVRPMDRQFVKCLHTMNDEFDGEISRVEAIKQREKRDIERNRIRKAKLEKQAKLLKEMGVAGEALVDEDEVEKDLLREEALAKGGNNGQIFVEGEAEEASLDIEQIENAADLDNDEDDAINHQDDGEEDADDTAPKKERRRREKGAKSRKKK
jgi:hypothetical protein